MRNFTNLAKEEQDDLLDKVYEKACLYESSYGCCPQAVLGAMYDVFGIGDKDLFRTAYGFGGGTGLTSQNSCGALVGIVLLIGWICGRTYENVANGRADKCYALSKNALEYFTTKYNGPLCKDVQECIMGKSFNLNVSNENETFLNAGGHEDKCPVVCGDACQYVARLLFSGELAQ